jgi:hypothetical protein
VSGAVRRGAARQFTIGARSAAADTSVMVDTFGRRAAPDAGAPLPPFLRRTTRLSLAAFVLAVLIGAWLRFRMWGGPTSDELAMVVPLGDGGLRAFFANPEWGRNSPLLPLLFAGIHRPATLLLCGRILVVICSLAAAIPVFFAARRATGGDPFAAALAGAFVAWDPMLANEGVTFRAYGVFALVEGLRLLWLVRAAEEPRPRTLGVLAALTALLPWIHYAAFPILAFECVTIVALVPGHRRILWAHLAAALAWVPLLVLLVRVYHGAGPIGVRPWSRASFMWTGGIIPFAPYVAALLALLFRLHRRARRGATSVIVAHAFALAGAALLLAFREFLRPAAGALGAASMGLCFGALAEGASGRTRKRNRVVFGLLALGTMPLQFDARGNARHIPPLEGSDIASFAADLAREPGAGEWHVFPTWNLHVLEWDLHARDVPAAFNADEVMRVGAAWFVPERNLQAPAPGRLLVFSCRDAPTRCRRTGGRRCAQIYECP